MDVERLTLADEGTTVGSEVDDLLLGDFPDGLVNGLGVGGDVGDVLDGAIVRDDQVLHVVIPETEVDELSEEPWANNLEFTSEDTTSVDVAKRVYH